ncbi:beta-1,3-galactosyltransferase 1-like [Artemia franciscana]|nr:hypothetical protein QYM36_005613 [Artemia franciscana]
MAVRWKTGVGKVLQTGLAAGVAFTLLLLVVTINIKTPSITPRASQNVDHVASRALQEAASIDPGIPPSDLDLNSKGDESVKVVEVPPIAQGGTDEILAKIPDLKEEAKKMSVDPTKKIATEKIKVTYGAAAVSKVIVTKSVDKKSVTPVVSSEFENPPVLTSTLYVKGHTISSEICSENKGSDLRLLVLVTSAPGHRLERSAVRGTWGHIALRKDVALAFFVGQSRNYTENVLLKEESRIYDDIIQGNFMDTYNNLTLKTMSMLEWASEHCSRTKFLLKTDDDMYINFPPLLKLVSAVKRPRLIFGKLAQKWKPIRNMSSKYYIPPRLYPDAYYPDFNTGPAYVLTGDIVKELYRESLNNTFYKLEDVYITGIIAKKLRIDHMHFDQFINRRVALETCKVKKAISIHMVKTYEMYDLWKRVSDGLEDCDKPKPRKIVKTPVQVKDFLRPVKPLVHVNKMTKT